jgi:hypothetical protein
MTNREFRKHLHEKRLEAIRAEVDLPYRESPLHPEPTGL